MDALRGDAVVGQAEVDHRPALQGRLHAPLALAVVGARGVDAFCGAEVALGVGALVDVDTGGQVGEGLLLATGDDVSAYEAEALVTADLGTVLEVVRFGLVLNDPIVNLGEGKAAFPGDNMYQTRISKLVIFYSIISSLSSLCIWVVVKINNKTATSKPKKNIKKIHSVSNPKTDKGSDL